MSNTTSPTTTHAVTFSPFSGCAFIPKDDIESKWYSTQAKNGFRRALIQDVRRIRRELEDAPTEATSPEQLYECLGLGVLLNQDFAMLVARKRRAHIDAILSEHRLQKEQGVCDFEKLSKVSENSSSWTRNKAQKLASAYSRLM